MRRFSILQCSRLATTTVFTLGLMTAGFFALHNSQVHAQTADQADISGDWHGTLVAGQFDPLEVIFHIQGEPGAWSAALDIPTHGRFGLAADSISVRNSNVTIRVNSIQMEYYGSLKLEDGQVSAIDGDWNQSGEYIPLKLTPAASE